MLSTDLTTTVALDKIEYLDFPELKFNEHESTQMPFRYVKGKDGGPIMPEVGLSPEFDYGREGEADLFDAGYEGAHPTRCRQIIG